MAEKSDDVSIESIKVKMAGETKTLTIEQARKLRDALLQLFPVPYVPSVCFRPHADGWVPWNNYRLGVCSSAGDSMITPAVNTPQTLFFANNTVTSFGEQPVEIDLN